MLVLFNSRAAAVASCFTCCVCMVPAMMFPWLAWWRAIPGYVVFVGLLFFWQRIRALLCGPKLVFLDRLCISQHDDHRKENKGFLACRISSTIPSPSPFCGRRGTSLVFGALLSWPPSFDKTAGNCWDWCQQAWVPCVLSCGAMGVPAQLPMSSRSMHSQSSWAILRIHHRGSCFWRLKHSSS